MCGIVGFITKEDKTRVASKQKFFTEALYMDALRGFHSTGIMSLHDDYMWQYQKQAVGAADFINSKGYSERTKETWCSVGHNRHATVGDISTDNAHPFKQGSITLVHNGTLHSMYQMEQNKDIEVDSELIAYNLNLVGPDKAKNVIGKLVGAYTLVWFDERDESVNIVRNCQRPLHLGLNSSGDILYFMSDGYMLNCISQRLLDSSAKPSTIWQLATEQILKYKKGDMVPEVTRVTPFTQVRSDWSMNTNIRAATPRSTGTYSSRYYGNGIPKIEVNGERVAVPKSHLDMLENWYTMDPKKEYCFRPFKYRPLTNNGNEGEMLGRIFHPEWGVWFDARVKCSKSNATQYKVDWSMVPQGLDFRDHSLSGDKVCFIGRIQWYSWFDGRIDTDDPMLDSKYEPVTQEEVENFAYSEEIPLVEGPHGDITKEAFASLTNKGCVMCAGNIDEDDHDTITWVGEMWNQPLCYDCLDFATEGGLHDAPH